MPCSTRSSNTWPGEGDAMIRDYEHLAIVRKQLALAEDALVSLHKRVYEKNPRNYTVFSESYIDMILQLRGEIDTFLKVQPPNADIPPTGNGSSGDQADD